MNKRSARPSVKKVQNIVFLVGALVLVALTFKHTPIRQVCAKTYKQLVTFRFKILVVLQITFYLMSFGMLTLCHTCAETTLLIIFAHRLFQ